MCLAGSDLDCWVTAAKEGGGGGGIGLHLLIKARCMCNDRGMAETRAVNVGHVLMHTCVQCWGVLYIQRVRYILLW